jgi:hypothetical protein
MFPAWYLSVQKRIRVSRGLVPPPKDDDDDDDDGAGVFADSFANGGIEAAMEEPQPSEPSSLLQELLPPFPAGSVLAPLSSSFVLPPDSDRVATRLKARKRAFDRQHARLDPYPTFDIEREYTFEFFQQQGDVLALAV